jgi:hypothetical protein
MKLTTVSTIAALLVIASGASAIEIDAGPTWTPPGLGDVEIIGQPQATGGRTVNFTDMDLSATANLYYGIKNDMYENGCSMTGTDIIGDEIFRFDSVSFLEKTILYTATTEITTAPQDTEPGGTFTVPLHMTLTFTGPGEIVRDTDTEGLSGPLGDVAALWWLDGDFSVHIAMEAQVPPGFLNAGNWESPVALYDRVLNIPPSTILQASQDGGFYYEELPEPSAALLQIASLGLVAALARRR